MSKNIDKLAELATRRNELADQLKEVENDLRLVARDVAAENLQQYSKPAVRRGSRRKAEAVPRVSTSGPGDQSDHTCMVTEGLEAAACLLTLWEDGECLSTGDVLQRALAPGFAVANGLDSEDESGGIQIVKSWISSLVEAGRLTRSGKGRGTVYSVTVVTE